MYEYLRHACRSNGYTCFNNDECKNKEAKIVVWLFFPSCNVFRSLACIHIHNVHRCLVTQSTNHVSISYSSIHTIQQSSITVATKSWLLFTSIQMWIAMCYLLQNCLPIQKINEQLVFFVVVVFFQSVLCKKLILFRLILYATSSIEFID